MFYIFHRLLLFLVYTQVVHGHLCYSNSTFYYSQKNFFWNNFTNYLRPVPTVQQSLSTPCHVRISVDYNSMHNRSIIIKFGSPIIYNHTHIEFGSQIEFLPNNHQSIVSYLDYTCLSDDLCERKFLDYWPKLLLNNRNNSLHTSFLPLWDKSNSNTSKCQADRVTNTCASYLCFMIYDELKNLSYGKFHCNELSSTNPVLIHVKTYSGSRTNDYQCTKNLCTQELSYNLTLQPDYDELMMKRIRDETNKLIFQRAALIVSVLVIIACIACWIQCRNYRRGYRLTKTTA
ncbi:unnamed protein product [Adineta ricciae]|uniref:Uncharacterized protein n=1 Tax=Adineta ricciae TaxID=249248 RepID=A0A814JWN1_ADIRI|nr:unnamed protein product [Adineta ricciae]